MSKGDHLMNIKNNWANYSIEPSDEVKIKEVCNELFFRLTDCQRVMPNKDISLAHGIAGVILFMNECSNVLGIDSDEYIHSYVKYASDILLDYSQNISLYTGLSGFSYVISLIHDSNGNYNRLLTSLDDVLSISFNEYLNNNDFNNMHKSTYDVISGLSGILRYILKRVPENPHMERLLYLALDRLCDICEEKVIENNLYKGWIVYKTNKVNQKELFSYDLGFAHGVSGIISIISLIKLNGFESVKSMNTLKNLLDWMKNINETIIGRSLWPSELLPTDNSIYKESIYKRAAWCYGSPGVASSFNIASKAIYLEQTNIIAKNIIDNMFMEPVQHWLISSPMLCHGFSGILNVLFRIDGITNAQNYRKNILNNILTNIDFDKNYCFINKDINSEEDSYGFLSGSCGIGLSLLSAISQPEIKWDQLLLLN